MTRIIAVADMVADMGAQLEDECIMLGETPIPNDILNAVSRLEYILTEEDEDDT